MNAETVNSNSVVSKVSLKSFSQNGESVPGEIFGKILEYCTLDELGSGKLPVVCKAFKYNMECLLKRDVSWTGKTAQEVWSSILCKIDVLSIKHLKDDEVYKFAANVLSCRDINHPTGYSDIGDIPAFKALLPEILLRKLNTVKIFQGLFVAY